MPASPPTLAAALIDPDSYATTLVAILLDTYGGEALSWSPAALRLELRDDFRVDVPPAVFDRMMAGVSVVTTDWFYKSLPRFIALCNVLAGDSFEPGEFNPADSLECAWGITEALLLNPPQEPEPFVPEIRHYIGQVLLAEGYVAAPDVLRLAITPRDFADHVRHNWGDDPELSSAIYQTQDSRREEVTAMLRENLRDLVGQLTVLPLKNGKTASLLSRLSAAQRPQREPL